MTRVRSAKILVAAIVVLVGVFQPAAAQDGGVFGVVINAVTGEPLEGSIVELYRVIGSLEDRSVDPYLTTAGGDGRFSFQNVRPGQYRLVSFRNDGFVGAEFGQRSFNSPAGTFTLRAGETFDDIRLPLTPTAAISGRVRDVDGEPLGRVRVQAMKRAYLGPGGEPESLMIVQAAYTNDLGEYRLFWLAPGQYIVSAIEEDPRDQPTPLFNAPNRANLGGTPSAPRLIRRMLDDGTVQDEVAVPTFFPNTQDEEAAAQLSVRAGEELGGIDVTLGPPIPTRRVRGRVINGATGQVARQTVVQISSASRSHNPVILRNRSDDEGWFEISGILPGRYYVSTVIDGPTFPEDMTAYMFLQVGEQDVDNYSITARPHLDLPVNFTVDGPTSAETVLSVQLLRGAKSRIPYISLGAPNPALLSGLGSGEMSRTAVLRGVRPGDYAVQGVGVGGFRNAYIKTATLGGVDVLRDGLYLESLPDSPLEILVGTDVGAITGVVRQGSGAPLPSAYVTLVPNASNRDRNDLYFVAFTDSAGQFSMRGLTPGAYLIFAWEEVQRGSWRDANFIEAFERFERAVVVQGAGAQNVDMTAIPEGFQ